MSEFLEPAQGSSSATMKEADRIKYDVGWFVVCIHGDQRRQGVGYAQPIRARGEDGDGPSAHLHSNGKSFEGFLESAIWCI